MPKSLTEMICSIPEREAGEMKLPIYAGASKNNLFGLVRIYLEFIDSGPVKEILVFVL